MAIQPPSDLLLDVTRAADPTRAATVLQKLNQLAADGGASGADFASALQQTESPTSASSALLQTRVGDQIQPAIDPADKAKTKFEAVLLSSMIQEMMPKDAPEAFGGSGFSGDMWKSLLAEKMADQIAKSGSLGLGRRLFSGGASAASALMQAHASSAIEHSDVVTMSANALSLPSDVSTPDNSYLFAHGKI